MKNKIYLIILYALISNLYPVSLFSETIDTTLAKKVALYYGSQFYQSVKIYDYKLFCDPLTGDPMVYQFILYISNKKPPKKDLLKNQVYESYISRKKLLEEIQNYRQNGEYEKLKLILPNYEDLSEDVNKSNEFATISIGATNEISVFISTYRGLPRYFINENDAITISKKYFNNDDIQLPTSYICFDPISYGYTFEKDGKKIFVDQDLKITKPSNLKR